MNSRKKDAGLEEELVPLVVAAKALGYRSYGDALDAIIANGIPSVRVRNRWYVPRVALEALIAGRAV